MASKWWPGVTGDKFGRRFAADHCGGCGAALAYPRARLCQPCWFAMLEGLAAKIEPSYDPSQPQSWFAMTDILERLYGRDSTTRDRHGKVINSGLVDCHCVGPHICHTREQS